MKRHHIDESLWLAEDEHGEIRLLENDGESVHALSLVPHARLLAQEVMRLRAVLDFAGALERLGGAAGLETDLGTVWRLRGQAGYRVDLDADDESANVLTASDAARLAHGLPCFLAGRVVETLRMEKHPARRVALRKGAETCFASPGYALDRALSEGWTLVTQ